MTTRVTHGLLGLDGSSRVITSPSLLINGLQRGWSTWSNRRAHCMVRRRIFYGYMDGEAHIRTFTGQCEPELVAFEADFRRSQWAKVTTLRDDQALFLGPCSRAVRMSQCDTPGSRLWFLNDDVSYYNWASIDSTIDMTNTKSSSPLPMISWPATMPCAGAAWLFPLD
uniref:DUF295 domain-containing protein n=1 Tax=Arundo donax TaxID=35708 RepID=A0A0A8XQG2_ARUDO